MVLSKPKPKPVWAFPKWVPGPWPNPSKPIEKVFKNGSIPMDFDETGTDRKLSMWPTFWGGSGTSWGPFKPDWVAMEVMGGSVGGLPVRFR